MTDEEYDLAVSTNNQFHLEELERLGMTESEYEEYEQSRIEIWENRDMEEYAKEMESLHKYYNCIEPLMELFENLTEDEQDFFNGVVETRIKQRDPEYDIYADTTINQSLGLEDLNNNMNNMKNEMIDLILKLTNKKEVNVNKRHLSVAEFEIEFNISKSKQQILRGRGMPIVNRKSNNGKIVYEYNEVKKWMDNNGI
jgi:hypothetical protein